MCLLFLILLFQISLLSFQQKIDSRLKSRVSVAARLLHSHRETHHTTLRDALMQCSTFEPHLFIKKCGRTMSTHISILHIIAILSLWCFWTILKKKILKNFSVSKKPIKQRISRNQPLLWVYLGVRLH